MTSSSSSFASTVELRLQPSLRALQAVFLIHLLGIAMLPLAMQPGLPMFLLLGGFAASWFWLRRHPALGFGPRAITRLVWHADGGWSLYCGEPEIKAELLGNSIVHARLLVLNFRSANGRKLTRLITGGETDGEPLRRLRARLLLGQGA